MNFCNPLDKLYIKGVKQFSDLQEYSKKKQYQHIDSKNKNKTTICHCTGV